MQDDVLLNKIAELGHCLTRINEEYQGHEQEFESELRRQDSVILNLTRACENSIDLANHIVKIKKLGIPQTSRESFELLESAELISQDLCNRMKRMVGFRNIAIHSYARLSLAIIIQIIQEGLTDFDEFSQMCLTLHTK
jgi:uncharacterized protein YutE (UPF0331/DUF86 family)